MSTTFKDGEDCNRKSDWSDFVGYAIETTDTNCEINKLCEANALFVKSWVFDNILYKHLR